MRETILRCDCCKKQVSEHSFFKFRLKMIAPVTFDGHKFNLRFNEVCIECATHINKTISKMVEE